MIRALVTIVFLFTFSKNIIGQKAETPLKITPLTSDFYIFTTYNFYQGNRVPSNGMYLVTNDGIVMFDTPWDTSQFQPLLDTIKARHHKNVVLCIATHFHSDRTAGLEYYRQRGIKTYTTRRTDDLSKERGMKRAEFLMDNDTAFTVGQYSFEAYFPGPGHAPDNIVIWFEREKILYGGCLIKSVKETNLGNLSDADINEYATTIKNVEARYSLPRYIVTGHGDWTNTNSLDHTLKMAEQLKLKN